MVPGSYIWSLVSIHYILRQETASLIRSFVTCSRCWTEGRTKKRVLQDCDLCALCHQETETMDHLLVECERSLGKAWGRLMILCSCSSRGLFGTWKERNSHVLDKFATMPAWLLPSIKLEADRLAAGFRRLSPLLVRWSWKKKLDHLYDAHVCIRMWIIFPIVATLQGKRCTGRTEGCMVSQVSSGLCRGMYLKWLWAIYLFRSDGKNHPLFSRR